MKFKPAIVLILGAILTAAEAVQLTVIPMSSTVHLAITELIAILATAGVLASKPSQIQILVPHELFVVITAVIPLISALQTDWPISLTAHRLIQIVLVAIGAVFGTNSNLIPVASLKRLKTAYRIGRPPSRP